jgi:hypothetical protein
MTYRLLTLFLLSTIFSCQTDNSLSPNITEDSFYFPPINTSDWENISPNNLNWNLNELEELENFLIDENTKSFMVLVDGKIVVEE